MENIDFIIEAQKKSVKAQNAAAYTCCKNMIFGNNQTIVGDFPIV